MLKRLWVFACLFLSIAFSAHADLEVHFVNVGHGDCAIVVCDGAAMVIDGGSPGKSDTLFAYLTELNITHLQAVVGTHPDSDHVGGLPAAFHAAQVDALYVPVMEHSAERHATLIAKAQEMGVPIRIPDDKESFALGDAIVTFYCPQIENPTDNNLSIVTRITYGKHAFMFCADIDKDAELVLMGNDYDLYADVLKVAHHGSDESSSMHFLSTVNADYAVISGNSQYTGPKDEVPQKIISVGSTLLHTQQNGNIVITSTGNKLKISPAMHYIGNSDSRVFHRASCWHVDKMKTNNKSTLYTREQAAATGYTPCKTCDP